MAEMFPRARVLHLQDNAVPQEPAEHPDFWSIWRSIVHTYHPEPIDFVFASEAYGHRLAAEVGASFVPVDPGREVVHISGTEIRQKPYQNWHAIPAVVRPYYLKRICIFGPESTGKSTLARHLADAYETAYVPEYGRIHTENFGTDVTTQDLLKIMHGHRASEKAAAKTANRLLFSDTDPLLTLVWSDMLLGTRGSALVKEVAHFEPADLYLLTDVDVPWVDDGTRYFSSTDIRKEFFGRCEEELRSRSLPYVILKGSWAERCQIAREVIDKLMIV
jgi:NadR type nicotinamide-nucleotide adenylyltransferase